jgi:hypothetical protein
VRFQPIGQTFTQHACHVRLTEDEKTLRNVQAEMKVLKESEISLRENCVRADARSDALQNRIDKEVPAAHKELHGAVTR